MYDPGDIYEQICVFQKLSFLKNKIFVFEIPAMACWKADDLADGENSADEDEDDDEKEVEMES